MMKVRAIQDGHYGGYYRMGPIETESGTVLGEVFEIDETLYEVKDEHGRPVLELDEDGKPIPIAVDGKTKRDAHGKPVFKIKMATMFSKEWMVRVADDTEVTNDYPPINQLHQLSIYRKKKQKQGRVIALPEDVAKVAGIESPI